MGVSDHGKPLALDHGKWVPIFLNAVGADQIRREGYLCLRAASGEVACKACGKYLPESVPLDAHFRGHLAELDFYLKGQRAEKHEESAEGVYPHPCERCGEGIARTGKPGRPPKLCVNCEFPLADLQVEIEPYSEAELALLEEFGV
jgi:hypothetical protein